MDKIQELHKKAWLSTNVPVTFKAYATITEDLMGRFAEWASNNGFEYHNGAKQWIDQNTGIVDPTTGLMIFYTTSELIQLFKETL